MVWRTSGSPPRGKAVWGRVTRVLLLLGAVCIAACSGCGDAKDDDVVITESAASDFAPAPGESVITATKSPRPTSAATKATPRPAATASGAATSLPSTVPFLALIPSLAVDKGEFQPRVQIELAGTFDGKSVTVVDETSVDGAGAKGLFRSLKPGRYLMKVRAGPAAVEPLLTRPIDVDGQKHENLAFGAVVLRIPKERSFEVSKAIELSITEEPAKKPVFKGPLASAQTKGLAGEDHPLTLLLPFGKYSYALADHSKDPTIGFFDLPKGTPLALTENSFSLDEGQPVAIVNLETVIRVK